MEIKCRGNVNVSNILEQTDWVKYTLRNYFYIDMDPLHPMSFWHLLGRLDMDIYPQNRCDGFSV